MLGSILRLYADDIIDIRAQPAAYGLDEPDMILSVTGNNQTQTAVFRLEQNNTSLMAQPEGSVIYRLDADPVLMLMQDYTTLMGSSIINYRAAELADLTIMGGEQRLFIEFTGTVDSPVLQIGEDKLSQEEAAQLMKAVNSSSPVGQVTRAFDVPAQISLKAYFKNGMTETAEFIPLQEDRFAVSIGGNIDFATNGQAVQGLWDVLGQYSPQQKEGK